MTRLLVINPNSSIACTNAIDGAIASLRSAGGPVIEVVSSPDGPVAIYAWRDWHASVEPMCRIVAAARADAVVVACASDPGLDAVRALTASPVFGIFRCAVALALARADRFGVVALVDASIARHALALRAMGVEHRLAGERALNVSMDELLDPVAARARLIEATCAVVREGAQAVVLGCTGMAAHRAAIEAACGVPVIEPCRAGVAVALEAIGQH